MVTIKKILFVLLASIFSISILAAYLSTGNVAESEENSIIEFSDQALSNDSVFSVMTYNLGYLSGMANNLPVATKKSFFDNNLSNAKAFFDRIDVDIIGFQEIDFSAKRSYYVNQLKELSDGYSSAYQSINWDKKYVPFPYWPPSNHFGEMLSGQAILTNYSIQNAETIRFIKPINAPFYYNAFYPDRLLQIIDIKIGNRNVKAMNVHLEAFDSETRIQQIKVVKEQFEKYANHQPVLLIGDFNSEIPSQAEEKDAIEDLIKANWISSAVSFEKELQSHTFSSASPEKMIDYIFYNSNFLSCDSARVLNEASEISDHLPVWAQFHFK